MVGGLRLLDPDVARHRVDLEGDLLGLARGVAGGVEIDVRAHVARYRGAVHVDREAPGHRDVHVAGHDLDADVSRLDDGNTHVTRGAGNIGLRGRAEAFDVARRAMALECRADRTGLHVARGGLHVERVARLAHVDVAGHARHADVAKGSLEGGVARHRLDLQRRAFRQYHQYVQVRTAEVEPRLLLFPALVARHSYAVPRLRTNVQLV